MAATKKEKTIEKQIEEKTLSINKLREQLQKEEKELQLLANSENKSKDIPLIDMIETNKKVCERVKKEQLKAALSVIQNQLK